MALHQPTRAKPKFATHLGSSEEHLMSLCVRPTDLISLCIVALPRIGPKITYGRLLIHSDIGTICRRLSPLSFSLRCRSHSKLMTDESIATTTQWQIRLWMWSTHASGRPHLAARRSQYEMQMSLTRVTGRATRARKREMMVALVLVRNAAS